MYIYTEISCFDSLYIRLCFITDDEKSSTNINVDENEASEMGVVRQNIARELIRGGQNTRPDPTRKKSGSGRFGLLLKLERVKNYKPDRVDSNTRSGRPKKKSLNLNTLHTHTHQTPHTRAHTKSQLKTQLAKKTIDK